ncbi:MAG: sodium-dependent transporter, partial [bacterium]
LILAMAGNAVGLGNFLRFPVQATQNGGGAFMIPYFAAFLFLAIPLMWAEWAMGRLGGSRGHGTAPGFFSILWKHPAAKYLGVLGILFPLSVVFYYTYVESWTLAYSFFSLTGKYLGISTRDGMAQFLAAYQGVDSAWGVSITAYVFFLLTFALNIWILSGGISKGIERLANIGMPILFFFAVFLAIRVFFIGTPDPALPENNILNGLGFIWNPDMSRLSDAKVWLAAAGQIFFTTSIGFGVIQCYASYLREKDDIVATGLTTAMTNGFVEVLLGGSIAIPIAFAFFGMEATLQIAHNGSYNLGFAAMPVIFQKLPLGQLMGTMWFGLLFIAGITSSVALMQPLITFLKDELGYAHKKALFITAAVVFIFSHVAVLGLKYGALDELDFWAGTFGLVLLALIEVILFVWVFGPKNACAEIKKGAQINVPGFFFFILKYVTPVYLLVLFAAWITQQGPSILSMEGLPPEDIIWRWAARLSLVLALALIAFLVSKSRRLKEVTSTE